MKKILLPLAAIMLWSCSEEIDAPLAENAELQCDAAERLSPYDQAAIAISQKAIGSISGTAASRSAAPLLTLKETLCYPAASRGADEEQPVTIYNFNEGGYSVVKNIGGYPELLVYSDTGRFDPADEIPQMLLTIAMDFQDSIPTPKYSVEPVFVGPTRWHYDHICNAKRIQLFENDVPALLQTDWADTSPYNFEIYINGMKMYDVGCGGIAVSQVLAYYEKPAILKGTQCRWSVYKQKSTVDPWDSYASELSKIINIVVNGCKSRYIEDPEQIVTKMSDIVSFLRTCGYGHAQLNAELNLNDIFENIKKGYPVIVRGKTSYQAQNNHVGHIFIVDGVDEERYRDDYFNADTHQFCESLQTYNRYFHVNFGTDKSENCFCRGNLFNGSSYEAIYIDDIYPEL